MTAATAEVLHTPEELLELPDGHRYDLVDGKLVERKMGAISSRIAAILIALLEPFARSHKLGRVFATDCGYQIFPAHPTRVRFPDGSFIRQDRLPAGPLPAGHSRIVPDLVIEAVSPNDEATELDVKIEEYLQVGVGLIWVFYPATQRVMVFRKDGTVSRLGGAAELSGEPVLPGFSVRVEEIFNSI